MQSASSFIPYNQEIQDHLAEINKEKTLLLAVPLLSTPKCHGSVRAKETGPTAFDKPHIHYNFLCEKDGFDEIALIQAMERIQTFPIRSKTWRASCAAFVRLPLLACDKPYLNETTNDFVNVTYRNWAPAYIIQRERQEWDVLQAPFVNQTPEIEEWNI